MSLTRIVVTETEETYFQVKVVVGDNDIVSNVEMDGVEKVLNNKSFVREQFFCDVRDLEERIKFSEILQEMVRIIDENDGDIIQVVYETDQERFPKLKEMGYDSCRSENSKILYFIKESDGMVLSEEPNKPFDNISNSVEHIEKFFDFHTQKVVQDPWKHSDDHLVNLDDVVYFLGFTEHSLMVRTFKKSNYILNLEHHIIDSFDEEHFKDILENEHGKIILVVNPFHTELALEIMHKYTNKVSLCVYETETSRESSYFLSTCSRYKIMHVKRAQHSNIFNFGVVNEYEKCSAHIDNYHNGVISLNDNVWVEEKSFIVFLDPRYSNMVKALSAMEICKDVWTITIIHSMSDFVGSQLYEYKFFPYYQTENLTHLHKLMKMGVNHTPVAFYTTYPAIARLLFDASVFVSCDKDHLIEYVNNCTKVFKDKIHEGSKIHMDKINDAKALAIEMKKKVELVKVAQQKKQKKDILSDINKLKI